MPERPARPNLGQVVVAQVAVAAVLASAAHPAAVVVAVVMLAATFARVRHRWLYQWLAAAAGLAVRRGATAVGPAVRRRTRPADAGGTDVLPRAGVAITRAPVADQVAGVLLDPYGVTALLELATTGMATPGVVDLSPDPGVQLRVVLSARPAGAGRHPPARGYRALAGDPGAATQRALVAVRIPEPEDLAAAARGPLTRAVRQAQQRLAPLPARLLDPDEIAPVLVELGWREPVREGWASVRAGAATHVCYRVAGPPGGPPTDPLPPELLPALLPAAAAVTLAAGPDGGWMRLSDPLAATGAPGVPAVRQRLDGAQLRGLRATLPLPPAPGAAETTRACRLRMPLARSGVLLGRGRDGETVAAPLPRPRPGRIVLLGSVAVAWLLVWRALGAGLPVAVHTGTRADWQALAAAAAPAPLRLAAPDGAPAGPAEPGEPGEPSLQLADAGVAPPPGRGAWSVVATRLPRLTTAALDLVAGADLVLAEPVPDREATLLSAARGLGSAGAALRQQAAPGELVMVTGQAVTWFDPALAPAERELWERGPGRGTAATQASWQDSVTWVSS